MAASKSRKETGVAIPLESPNRLDKLYKAILKDRTGIQTKVFVCGGPGCLAIGAQKIHDAIREAVNEGSGAAGKASVELATRFTGCQGLCQQGPLVTIEMNGSGSESKSVMYVKVKPGDVSEIVEKTVRNGEIIDRLLYMDGNRKKYVDYREIPFFKHQVKIALRNVGVIDPLNIRDYIANGGYQALARVLVKMKPDEVTDMIGKAKLRGRGGGGFDTARKWRSCKKAEGTKRYVICNGDEGDPGAFMDRAIMEGDPHSVLEGMIIGAYALESNDGYVYVREEYPLAIRHLQHAIEEAKAYGFLGENILGCDFSFDIKINRGGGAFVCGESSALMASIAGKVGEPRAKYVHSVERGLHDQPTVLNNVETWVNVPWIVINGPEAFTAMGTKKSAGTKVFSLVGKVRNTGLVEIPMGMTLREIVYEIGAGILDDKEFKGIQTGGPSGGCVPKELMDLPVDFEKLTDAGSMMGSGGMIVMDERTCMVDVARYFLKFLIEESCGKCVPCREGLRQMLYMLDDIVAGKGKIEDLDRIERLSADIIAGSLCALGKSAPNPVLSTIRYFRDEYEKHIVDKVCPAGICKALTTFTITENCTGCALCVKVCPVDSISGEKKKLHVIDQESCIKCGACYDVCKFDAIAINRPVGAAL